MGPDSIFGFLVALVCVSGMLLSAMRARRERRKKNSAMRLMQAMFEKSSVGKTETVPGGGSIIRANDAVCEFLGYTRSELQHMAWRDITHPDDHAEASQKVNAMVAAFEGGDDPDPATFFVRYRDKSGKYRPAFVSVSYVAGDEDCAGILLAEIQRADQFVRVNRETRERRGVDFTSEILAN